MTIPDNDFGSRVRDRLRTERVIWLTSTAPYGTPQPNPVWFIWDGADTVLVYSANGARRLAHLDAAPRVALNFNSDPDGGDVVVFRGTARRAPDRPAADQNPDYVAKYGAAMKQISGSAAAFAAAYGEPIEIHLDRVRGF